jgi:hypothetical protein
LDEGDSSFDWLMVYFPALVKFYNDAAEAGDGILIAIT